MPHSFNKIWIHAIWATKERAGCSSPLGKKNPVRHCVVRENIFYAPRSSKKTRGWFGTFMIPFVI